MCGKEDVIAVGAQKQLPAVHPRAGEIACNGPSVSVQSKHDDDSAGLILSEKGSGPAADHDHGQMLLIGFHVNPGAITGVTLNIDSAAAHGVARRIPDVPVNHNGPRVHGVAYGVLRVPENLNLRAVQIRAQRVARNTVYINLPSTHASADKPLTQAAADFNVVLCFTQKLVQHGKFHGTRVNFRHYTTPPSF